MHGFAPLPVTKVKVMGARVINFAAERAKKRRHFLITNGGELDRFISNFLTANLTFDFLDLAQAYQARQNELESVTWDYLDLRDIVANLLSESIAPQLYKELCEQRWFDSRWVSREQIIERCVSIFILGRGVVANQ